METILVWALVIAAIAILLMLILLIASERDLKRKTAEVEALRSRYRATGEDSSGETTSAKQSGAENSAVYTEISALNEQLQSTINTLEAELERLRAENTGLSQTNKEIRSARKPPAQSGASSKFAAFTLRASGHRRNRPRGKRRAVFVGSVAALLLLTGAAIFLISDWQESDNDQPAEGQIASESQSHKILASEKTRESSEPGEAKATVAMDAGEKSLPAPIVVEPLRGKAEKPSNTKTTALKTAVPVNASYEIIEATRVFSEPNEGSRPVARVEAGTEINVVSVRDDWLEVRSRHGRPPGFVRKNTAVKRTPN